MLQRLAAIAVVSLSFCHVAFAADTPQYGAAGDWVRPTSIPADSVKSTDAAVRILLIDRQFNFDPSADEAYTESIVRIQTPQGLAAMGTLSLPWNPDTDTLTIHKLVIRRGDQVVDVLGAGQKFTVLRRENKLEYAALDGILTAVIQPPGLQVNDVLDIAFTLKRSEPALRGRTEWLDADWPPYPIANLHVSAQWKTGLGIRWRASPALKEFLESRGAGLTRITLSRQNLQPVTVAKYVPARYRVGNELEFTAFRNWSELAGLLAPLYANAEVLQAQSPLAAEILKIRASSRDTLIQAGAALQLVQDQVRYVFLGMNDGGLMPAGADLTWTRRFGDCKGKTVLLLALLHGLGIDAEPVAVNTVFGDAIPDRLPMATLFDHVLVRARIGGRTYWLDGTRTGDRDLSRIVTPYYHWGLPLVRSGADLIAMVPPPLSEPQVRLRIRVDASAGIDKPAPIHAESELGGDTGPALKASLANLTPENLDRGLRNFWEKQFDNVKIASVAASFNDRDGSETLVMDGSVTLDWRGKSLEIGHVPVGFNADFDRGSGPDKEAPYEVNYPTYARVNETILLPDGGKGFTVSEDNWDKTVAGIHYSRQATLESSFTVEANERSVAPEFPASEAVSAQASLREMARSVPYLYAPAVPAQADVIPKEDHIESAANLLRQRKPQEAAAEYSLALTLTPDSAVALKGRAAAYGQLRKFEAARADLESVVSRNPSDRIALQALANLDLRENDPQRAIADLTRQLAVAPADADTLWRRGEQYASLGDYPKALNDFGSAIQSDPKKWGAYTDRAVLFRVLNQPERSLAEARSLIATFSGNADAYALAGVIYANSGAHEESMRAFEQAETLEPDAKMLLTRAMNRSVLDLVGRRADLLAALQADPASLQAKSALAGVDEAAADHTAAVALWSEVIKASSATTELLTQRGISYLKANQQDLAQADFAQARKNATGAANHNNMCWSLATANVELNLALSECDAALATEPDVRAYLDSKAFVLLRLGRLDEAIGTYDRILKIQPLQLSSRYGRGLARRRKGDPGSAADLQMARAIDSRVDDLFKSFGMFP